MKKRKNAKLRSAMGGIDDERLSAHRAVLESKFRSQKIN